MSEQQTISGVQLGRQITTLLVATGLLMMIGFMFILLWFCRQDNGALQPNCVTQYADASVQRRLCLEEEGVVLYTQGRGADAPIRQVLNAPSIQ